jgi:DNA-binding transcriptional LysR family regulator
MSENIELRHLRYFLALAEELHFTRAADRLGIAQPPLSQQIQRLEELLGAKLFVRRPEVKLTDAGEALLTVARRTLAQAEQGIEEVRRAGRGEGGTLLVGFATSTLLGPLPDLIRSYRKRYPEVRLSLRELSTADQQKALDNGMIEVGFLREPIADETLTCETILSEPFALVLPPRHPLTKRTKIDMADVAAEPFVHFPREVAPTLYDQVMGICRDAGFTPLVAQEASEWLTIVGLVEAGLGVSVVPSSFGKLGWGSVQYRPLSKIKKQTSIALCYKAESLSTQGRQFIQLVERMAHSEKGVADRP